METCGVETAGCRLLSLSTMLPNSSLYKSTLFITTLLSRRSSISPFFASRLPPTPTPAPRHLHRASSWASRELGRVRLLLYSITLRLGADSWDLVLLPLGGQKGPKSALGPVRTVDNSNIPSLLPVLRLLLQAAVGTSLSPPAILRPRTDSQRSRLNVYNVPISRSPARTQPPV